MSATIKFSTVIGLCASALIAGCASEPRLPTAADTFVTHCASCHGVSGQGDGPVAATIRGPVPDLTTLSRRNGGQFPADRVASVIDGRDLPPSHGGSEMPVWGRVFQTTSELVADAQSAESRVAELVEYVRSLQR